MSAVNNLGLGDIAMKPVMTVKFHIVDIDNYWSCRL